VWLYIYITRLFSHWWGDVFQYIVTENVAVVKCLTASRALGFRSGSFKGGEGGGGEADDQLG